MHLKDMCFVIVCGELYVPVDCVCMCKLHLCCVCYLHVCTDESTWNNVGSAYYSMVMYSNDSLKAVMAQVVPVVFLAMHDRPKAEDEGECGRVWVSVGGCVCVCVWRMGVG